jgi:nitrous oxidase accessory protein NosD
MLAPWHQAVILSCGLSAILLTAVQRQGTAQELVVLRQGMVIERSVTIDPRTYRLGASADLETPAITIRGENIVVDFNGAVLTGSSEAAEPDQFAGVAVLVDGGESVTIRGATIRGYKVGILARNSPGLRVTRNDLSHNWKQRLYSRIDKESLVDWMSYHDNEKDEWLRFGAAIYLSSCDGAEIDHNTALQGQNGLMATKSKGLKIWNNTFQFLSSIGVGLYRVSESTIMHNRIDWCVRGYSHGFYNRGQDSAGLLMYEQSSNNTVAYNSITHGGDGLFLWAGQSTMETGKGGANDNLFVDNDFSHAPTNGIETTFSRNRFVGNRVEDNWHGVWGGYSYESVWMNNRFARNAEAIAIEHGQDNEIVGNSFTGDDTAVRLWQNPSQDPEWGYPKHRDTRSRDYRIENNIFLRNETVVSLRDTANVRISGNRFIEEGVRLRSSGETPGLQRQQEEPAGIVLGDPAGPPRLSGGMDPMLTPGDRRGREYIIVDEWGPYDWKSPKLWPVLNASPERPLPYRLDVLGASAFEGLPHRSGPGEPVRLEVLGPKGRWRLASARGASATPSSGNIGDVLTVTPDARSSVVDWEVALDYTGEAVISPRGETVPAGSPYTFRYSQFHAPVDWTLRFYEYPETMNPASDTEAFTKRIADEPLEALRAGRIDFLSGREFEQGLPRDRFALVGEGIVDLPPGDYTLQVISDDGARVWIDGQLVLDAWQPHESRVDRADIRGGRRRLKVEYYETAGWAEMRLDILPRRVTK